MVDGEGGSSERCLRTFQNILKQGWVKAKVVRRGDEGFESVSNPAPPKKKLIVTLTVPLVSIKTTQRELQGSKK